MSLEIRQIENNYEWNLIMLNAFPLHLSQINNGIDGKFAIKTAHSFSQCYCSLGKKKILCLSPPFQLPSFKAHAAQVWGGHWGLQVVKRQTKVTGIPVFLMYPTLWSFGGIQCIGLQSSNILSSFFFLRLSLSMLEMPFKVFKNTWGHSRHGISKLQRIREPRNRN